MKVDELEKTFVEQDFIEKFIKLFGLRLFLKECIIAETYDFNNLSIDSIVLSPSGTELLEKLKKKEFSEINESILKLGIFLDFYNKDLLVDINETNYDSFFKSISEDVIKCNIKFPWIYGRTLTTNISKNLMNKKAHLKIQKF